MSFASASQFHIYLPWVNPCLTRHFQICDCEIFANLRFELCIAPVLVLAGADVAVLHLDHQEVESPLAPAGQALQLRVWDKFLKYQGHRIYILCLNSDLF